LKGYNSRTEPN